MLPTTDRTYWEEVQAIFAEAVDIRPDEWPGFVARRTAHRPALKAEVESLLEAHLRAEHVSRPTEAAIEAAVPGDEGGVALGSLIGPFRLVEAIGAGGMGTVFRAERVDGGFAQQVAIKLIALPLSHAATARRFRAERQILASLRHPHIVSLIDGGVTSAGQAYLVMEYVEGTPISTYCREHRLSLAERLRLFRHVCAAVHHAHRHFVVHRDLKPANILVTADGEPKVLDFGIAKLLDPTDPELMATVTGPGVAPLTPNYASPEQLRGLPVTTSSDVYALGVLLYEVITGVRPYETAGKPLDEVIACVLETECRRPSDAAADAASLPYDPHRALKGDIDAVVVQAMSKEPERRYASADEFGDDIERFLQGNPIQAREPSLGYVARKLVARHKQVFVLGAISLALIVAALAAAVWQARVATMQRQRAERRFNDVRQLANTLIFKIHDAVAPLAGSTPVRQTIVAEALQYLERLTPEAAGDASLQIELARAYGRIGRIQGLVGAANLGDREGAVASFRKAQDILAPLVVRPDAPLEVVTDYVESSRSLSETLNVMTGRRDAARAAAQQAIDAADRALVRFPADAKVRGMVASANFTAALTFFYNEGALPHWNRARDVYEALLAEQPDNPVHQRNVALVAKYLGTYYFNQNDLAASLRHHERARALDERRVAGDPSNRQAQLDLAIDFGNIGHLLLRKGELARGAEFYERSLAIRKSISESDPQDEFARTRTLFAQAALARTYDEMQEWARAYQQARDAIATFDLIRQPHAAAQSDVASALRTLGRAAPHQGRGREACPAFIRAFRILSVLSFEDRAEGVGLTSDPLTEAAESAAACGVTERRAK